jgi:AraC family transcriptional regulator, regulatory protein of adaptative response / methylated-DNA-[protein]-cysteine methyltransferase
MKPDDAPEAILNPGTGARDYERIARAIEYLRRNTAEQPDLAAVARHLHLSEHHFQRLFTRWAGVSPKRFLQFLTVESAKARLASSASILDLAGNVGLSGPGRLHDLFVTLEAVSPGEYKAGGAGLAIRYGIHDSPFGPALIATSGRGVCGLHFVDSGQNAGALLGKDWPRATLREDSSVTAQLAQRIFSPLASQSAKPLALLVKGSNFQLKVWRALLALPPGSIATYRHIARTIGEPTAARAVGNAIGANPVAWLIPCHRVIRESGELSRYRWGTERKAAMLGWEAARSAGNG